MLASKSINKKSFKRHMRNLWRPKAHVLIFCLEDERFAFGFNSLSKRNTILRGGPWLFNKQFMLVLAEANNMTYPSRVPLVHQESWIQVKGLPFYYMTRQMGKFLGNQLGKYVLTDQSRMKERFGSILRIRVRLDIQKPLRQYVALQLEGRTLSVDIRYEKLPFTCFLCGIMDHVEDQCEKYHGPQDNDYAKPYGR